MTSKHSDVVKVLYGNEKLQLSEQKMTFLYLKAF